MKWVFRCLLSVLAVVVAIGTLSFGKHAMATRHAERAWQDRPSVALFGFGQVESLEITVLAGPKADTAKGFIGEPGLSLLLNVDGAKWLYDLGLGSLDGRNTVRKNAETAGVDLGDVDAVFLSHRHRDHMGGVEAEKSGWLDLSGIGSDTLRIAAPPDALDMPLQAVSEIFQPAIIGEGIASLGPIRRALFVGPVDEQAMILDVRGYGLVAVVGCGHQTVPKLAERIAEVFDRPLKAVVGDLHFPVPEGRLQIAGIDAQRRLASGAGPFNPIGETQVQEFQEWATQNDLDVFLAGHDTHDAVLAMPFVTALEVGQTVLLPRSQ